MKIIRFEMYGYKRLIPGLGIDRIVLEFKNLNTISIINGPNGIGKSTILNAMTPLPDSTDNFVDGKEAGKILIYDNGYKIHIYSPINSKGVRQTSKAFISKNNLELNPTGNISSYKDLLFSEFGLDSCYITLTSLSSDDKGIAMKTPSARKKYFNGLLSNMDVYNDINKTMVKRSNIFKSMINNITSKISSIGDSSKLEAILSGIENELGILETQKTNLINQIAELKAIIKTKDPDSQIQNTYNIITEELDILNKKIKAIDISLKNREYESYCNFNIEELKNILDKYNSTFESNNNELNNITEKINSLLKSQQEELEFLQSKIARINTLKGDVDIDILVKSISNIEQEINTLNTLLLEHNISIDITATDLYHIHDQLNIIKDTIDIIKSYATSEELDIYKSIIGSNDIKKSYIEQQISKLENDLLDINNNITKLESTDNEVNRLIILSDLDSKLDCIQYRDKSCPIYNIIQDAKDRLNVINNNFSLNSMREQKKNLEEQMQKFKNINRIYIDMKRCDNIINSIYNKIGIIPNEFNISTSDISKYKELGNYKERINTLSKDLTEKKAIYSIYENKLDMIHDVENDIKKTENKLENISEELNNKKELSEKLAKDNSNIIGKINIIKPIIDILEQKEALVIEKRNKLQQISLIEDNMTEITSCIDNINCLNNKLINTNNFIDNKNKDRERIKYSLSMLQQYNEELEVYKEKYDLIETIKYYSSPTTGIQTLFMKLYMNNTLNICNDILSKMFNGNLVLDEYIINEEEFKIPCINNNIIIDDISSMSSSQVSMISMIISMVLLKQSSSIYNIVRLDEIDAGLDTNNRIEFINICMRLIDILGIDQVIMVSHNMMELNSINIDLIEIGK